MPRNKSDDLKSQVWLITGVTGIAAASARLVAQAGGRVYLVGLDADQCKDLASELGTDRCAWHAGDLRFGEVAEWAVRDCVERLGPVDALFNVAGGSGRQYGDGPLHLCSDQGWEYTIALNLSTQFYMNRAVLPQMMDRGAGAILNMATVTAIAPEPAHFATHAYAAAKGGVISMTRAMAAYYAPHGIRVNAIAPGLVKTPMSQRAQSDPEIQNFISMKQPLAGGMLAAEDIASAAFFLLSPASRQMTGQVLVVDGGWSYS